MELYDFLKHLNSGAPVYSDSEAFEYMHELSNEAMRITFRPVSYTHLDVYKRQ